MSKHKDVGRLVMENATSKVGLILSIHTYPEVGTLYSIMFGSSSKVLDASEITLLDQVF
tara:strand:- start:477 stop:653 length:177 start_codon:yes stop_codon:yes gene_type:complete